jgi:hypothetical protein
MTRSLKLMLYTYSMPVFLNMTNNSRTPKDSDSYRKPAPAVISVFHDLSYYVHVHGSKDKPLRLKGLAALGLGHKMVNLC